MFTIHCHLENATLLLGPRRIRGLDHTPAGIVVHWECYCGATGHNDPAGISTPDYEPIAIAV